MRLLLVEACRGTITCRNRRPSGLEVTMTLASAESMETERAFGQASRPPAF
jgi:hypothetical protein